jgi:hypothetical protein
LADILRGQNQLGDETRGLYERFLAISIRNKGLDGSDTAAGNNNLGRYYQLLAGKPATVANMQKQLLLAKVNFKESHRINSKIHGYTNPETIDAASDLAGVSFILSSISLTPGLI